MKKKLLKILQIFLAKCAMFYLYRTKPEVIGITGSVGKTSCRMIVSGVLEKYLPEKIVYTSHKNFNSELGLVFSIFQIQKYTPSIKCLLILTIKIFFASILRGKKYDIIVLEYGIDHPGDMDFLLGICKPDYSVFTKLDKVHSVYFNSSNGIGDEKVKLLYNTKKKVYLNPLDDFCRKIFDNINGEKQYFVEVKNYKLEKNENIFKSTFEYDNKILSTNLIGKENIDYIGLAFQILKEFGKEAKQNDFIKLDIQGGRFSIFEGINGNILIDSTYNASPESMKRMIENTFYIRQELFNEYGVILILGEMRELGDNIVGLEHQKLYEFVKNADALLLIGEKMGYLKQELQKNNYPNPQEIFQKSNLAGKSLKNYLEKSDKKYIILFKGSQNTIFVEESLKQVLCNGDDTKSLIRQSGDWLSKKEKFFNS